MKKIIYLLLVLFCGFLGGLAAIFLLLPYTSDRPNKIKAEEMETKALKIIDSHGVKRIHLYVSNDNTASITLMDKWGRESAFVIGAGDDLNSLAIFRKDEPVLILGSDKNSTYLMIYEGKNPVVTLGNEHRKTNLSLNHSLEPLRTLLQLRVDEKDAGIYTVNNGECTWASFEVKGKWPFK